MVDALNLGRRLRVRSTAYVAGEPVPFFWPMRTFIHHNPLYGLEDMPFEQAVRRGAELFHARMFLPRSNYQHWQREGKVRQDTLTEEIGRRSQDLPSVPGIDWPRWLQALMQTAHDRDVVVRGVRAKDVHAALHGHSPSAQAVDVAALLPDLEQRLHARTLPEAVDALWGTGLADELDELVIKNCLDFFDEDQSAWRMPGRERGLFVAWSEVTRRNARMFLRGLHMPRILDREALVIADDGIDGARAEPAARVELALETKADERASLDLEGESAPAGRVEIRTIGARAEDAVGEVRGQSPGDPRGIRPSKPGSILLDRARVPGILEGKTLIIPEHVREGRDGQRREIAGDLVLRDHA